MKLRLADLLACPACGEAPLRLAIDKVTRSHVWSAHVEPGEDADRMVGEVETGSLSCPGCGAVYPIVGGIPRMLPPGASPGPGTGHRLTTFDVAAPEYEANFRDLLSPVPLDAFTGRLVLDAGCGFGRHMHFALRAGAEVVGLDSSEEAVTAAARNLRDSVRAHVVQGDVQHPPFRKEAFDIVYTFGVLHHVEAPAAAFKALDALVAPGGRLSVWVYGPRQGFTRVANGALRGATAAMDDEQLYRFSVALARVLRVVSHTPHRLLGQVPLVGTVVTHLPVHDHSRWPFEIVVADVYDRLRVPVTAYFRGEDLERWFAEAGYADIQVTRRVRNTESFRGTGVRR